MVCGGQDRKSRWNWQTSLRQAALWDQGKDDLHKSALTLSGGQQQRLCASLVLSLLNQIYPLDGWTCIGLGSDCNSSTWGNYVGLKKDFYHYHRNHSMQQAARASDYTGFFYLGDLIERETANISNAKLPVNQWLHVDTLVRKGTVWQNRFCRFQTSVYYNKKEGLE